MISIKKITAAQTYHLRHTVMWPNHPIEFIKLDEDDKGVHFGLFKNDVLVCIASLFIKDKTAQFRKLATKVSEQGKGYATQILNHIILYCSQLKIEKLWCNARANKTSFYKKFGLEETSKTYIKGGINFIVLEKKF
mgnify:CR=1 FL=1|tara:strand:- start:10605 stop:11012 length:408 start_codon:yes stop_codon:yes gene_type:complete